MEKMFWKLRIARYKTCLFVLLIFSINCSNGSDARVKLTSPSQKSPLSKKSVKSLNFNHFPNSLSGLFSSENTINIDPCLEMNNPKRCLATFENVAFGRKVISSSTCGTSRPTKLPCDLSISRSSANLFEDMDTTVKHTSNKFDEERRDRRLVASRDVNRRIHRLCESDICDNSDPTLSHPTSHLTDLNNPSTLTCWISEPFFSAINIPATTIKIGRSSPKMSSSVGSTPLKISKKNHKVTKPELNKTNLNLGIKNKFKETFNHPNITLTLSFGKKYEITYVSLQFCSHVIPLDIPMAIYKSSDFGKTWNPYQFYANNCRHFFGIPAKVYASRSSEQEVLCTDLLNAMGEDSSDTIDFNPRTEDSFEKFKSLDRIIRERKPNKNASINQSILNGIPNTSMQYTVNPFLFTKSELKFSNSQSVSSTRNKKSSRKLSLAKSFLRNNRPIGQIKTLNFARVMENKRVAFSTLEGRPSAYNLDKSPVLQDWMTVTDIQLVFFSPNNSSVHDRFISLADLAVGGRCKCNGHAHRCISDAHGRSVCDCKHNTAGVDCEKCKPFHYDRPWGRATLDDPHPCIACHCNGHSRQCRFSLELYKMSGQRSGSVCTRCKHHTAGRNCHYCKEGYYRDYSKSITSKKACKRCTCHLIGSLDATCNHANGQCRCKEGVTGQSCNSCAKGYQQSRSPVSPCTRFHLTNESSTKHTPSTHSSVTSMCSHCSKEENLKRKLFCASEYVLQAKVRSIEEMEEWAVIRVFIYHSYKHPEGKIKQKSDVVWIDKKDLHCNCPYKIEENKTYLFVGSPGEPLTDMENNLLLTWKSHVTIWNKRLVLRMTQLVRGQQRGRCKDVMVM